MYVWRSFLCCGSSGMLACVHAWHLNSILKGLEFLTLFTIRPSCVFLCVTFVCLSPIKKNKDPKDWDEALILFQLWFAEVYTRKHMHFVSGPWADHSIRPTNMPLCGWVWVFLFLQLLVSSQREWGSIALRTVREIESSWFPAYHTQKKKDVHHHNQTWSCC